MLFFFNDFHHHHPSPHYPPSLVISPHGVFSSTAIPAPGKTSPWRDLKLYFTIAVLPTHVKHPILGLPRRLCHSLLCFLCRCHHPVFGFGKPFHEHIHGHRVREGERAIVFTLSVSRAKPSTSSRTLHKLTSFPPSSCINCSVYQHIAVLSLVGEARSCRGEGTER